ncbi:uncharacterized protein LOC132042042 [Lycium ferocissimum]|uniref:uncharacterized protein LOC132042042 n=1 Tax=Lycium ferocissimum TaxID=112874 RepID=UPI002816276B|nr:uncharacterized protein LOC132042042 [Lycium ferocissimum]
MDDTSKALRAINSHGSETVEFAAYQLTDAAHAWFELWEIKRDTNAPAPTWVEREDPFMERFLSHKERFALATKFKRIEQGTISVCEYSLKFTRLARYAMYMIPTEKYKLSRRIGRVKRVLRLVGNVQETTIRTFIRKLKVKERDIPKITFLTRYEHFEFLVMSFGLTDAPVAFMDMMNRVFKLFFDHFIIVFVDDNLVYSKSREKHAVSSEGIKADPQKIFAVKEAVQELKNDKVIAYASRQLKKHEKNYPTHNLELAWVTPEHQRPGGLAQNIEIPQWKWEMINMDFVVGLPRTKSRFDSIWVIVDRLTKSAYFFPVKTIYTAVSYAKLYLKEIVRLHGIPTSIISDRVTQFTAHFWKSFHEGMGTCVKFEHCVPS